MFARGDNVEIFPSNQQITYYTTSLLCGGLKKDHGAVGILQIWYEMYVFISKKRDPYQCCRFCALETARRLRIANSFILQL